MAKVGNGGTTMHSFQAAFAASIADLQYSRFVAMDACGAPSHPGVARASGRPTGATAAAAHASRPCLGPPRAQPARSRVAALATRNVTVEVEPATGAASGAASGVTRPKRAPRAKVPPKRVDHAAGNVRLRYCPHCAVACAGADPNRVVHAPP